MAEEQVPPVSEEKIKEYVENTGALAGAIVSMMKSDGWAVFMALYKREKAAIKEREDYTTIEEFKGDRAAIGIIDGILETFEGYIEEAKEAADLLSSSTDSPKQERGIMLIESVEESNRESQ